MNPARACSAPTFGIGFASAIFLAAFANATRPHLLPSMVLLWPEMPLVAQV